VGPILVIAADIAASWYFGTRGRRGEPFLIDWLRTTLPAS
jgi:hypothetical protein